MDDEHQELIKKMNRVHDLHLAKASTSEIQMALDDFAGFTIKHFSDEEAYMEKINFAGLETHKVIHQQLLKQVTEYLNEFKASGTLTDSFFNFLSVWLTSHIKGIDMKYSKKFVG